MKIGTLGMICKLEQGGFTDLSVQKFRNITVTAYLILINNVSLPMQCIFLHAEIEINMFNCSSNSLSYNMSVLYKKGLCF